MAIHAQSVGLVGGSGGMRDQTLLESALDRPKNIAAHDADCTIFQRAAAYCTGIVKNHPFIDGNKRTGYLATHTFLELNGYSVESVEADIVTYIVGLAGGSIDEGAIADWLADCSSPTAD